MVAGILSHLTEYRPTFYAGNSKSVWHRLCIRRRSAVLILLFVGKSGELRVILTKRSRKLRHFSGHVALPGGRADSGLETEWQVARRETDEEVGISRYDSILREKFGCDIKYINTMPCYISTTFLAVAPCIGFLERRTASNGISDLKLNPGESVSVFSVPLRDFLQPPDPLLQPLECIRNTHVLTKWGEIPWNLRHFIFPEVNNQEVKWLADVKDLSPPSSPRGSMDRHTRDCWGLTANILHDIADIAYNHDTTRKIGHEDLIWMLLQKGEMGEEPNEFQKRMSTERPNSGSFKECLPLEQFKYLQNLYRNR